MSIIKINCVKKDKDWDITHIWNNSNIYKKSDVIKEIENWNNIYKVNWETEIEVVKWENWKYLRSKKDNKIGNNLDELNTCSI